MEIFFDFLSLKKYLEEIHYQGKSVGFTPTMGALHQGHLSLLQKSVAQNKISICSIFVNPTQFNNIEDLKTYPRNHEKDADLLQKNHCDILFLPSVEEVYPNGEKSEHFDFNGLEHEMEGRFRPGHFDGVGTILHKLFSAIQPHKAYFGEKDFQQLRIVQTLAQKFFKALEIVPVDIYREENGLAMSSRNTKLSAEQRREASIIYKTLARVQQIITKENFQKIDEIVNTAFEASSLKLEYFIIANEENLKPLENFDKSQPMRAFIAAYAGGVRLIDNMKLN